MPYLLDTNIYGVGKTDWAIKNFHSYELSTNNGTSYNSYLIKSGKNILIDTVKHNFAAELIRDIAELIDPATLDYVIINHLEPDHAGSLTEIMQLNPNATVIVSAKGAESIGRFHPASAGWKVRVVRAGETLTLGEKKFTFIEARMLHWPDSMFTYLEPDNILFSNDAFGQHFASEFHFNDLVDQEKLHFESLKYFANILTPFCNQLLRKINALEQLQLKIKMIAPSHGVIWRDDPSQIINNYSYWAQQNPESEVLILYDSLWGSTRQMAEAISEGISEQKIPNKVIYLANSDRSDILADVFTAKALIIGSSTINNSVQSSLPPLLNDIKALRFKNKLGFAFGTYGWSGEAVRIIEENFAACDFPLIADGFRVKWRATAEELQQCRDFGKRIAEAVFENKFHLNGNSEPA